MQPLLAIYERRDPPVGLVLLDLAKNFWLDVAGQKEFLEECQTLHTLAVGLYDLYAKVRERELQILEKEPRLSNRDDMASVDDPHVICAFQWYSVSVCNYAWLVGHLAKRGGVLREDPKQYRDSVVGPGALAFRDKVAAHFARAVDSKKDNEAERIKSVSCAMIGFRGGHFVAPFGTQSVTRSGVTTDSRNMPEWSVTELHQNLFSRYWKRPASSQEIDSKPHEIPFESGSTILRARGGGGEVCFRDLRISTGPIDDPPAK